MFQLREVTPTPGTTTSPKDTAGKKEQLSTSTPNHGEVWLAVLDPGGPGGTRPVLVVSTDAFNAWPVGLVIVAPITTRDRGFDHHIAVAGGGLDLPSFVMPDTYGQSHNEGCNAASALLSNPPSPPSTTGYAASLAGTAHLPPR